MVEIPSPPFIRERIPVYPEPVFVCGQVHVLEIRVRVVFHTFAHAFRSGFSKGLRDVPIPVDDGAEDIEDVSFDADEGVCLGRRHVVDDLR